MDNFRLLLNRIDEHSGNVLLSVSDSLTRSNELWLVNVILLISVNAWIEFLSRIWIINDVYAQLNQGMNFACIMIFALIANVIYGFWGKLLDSIEYLNAQEGDLLWANCGEYECNILVSYGNIIIRNVITSFQYISLWRFICGPNVLSISTSWLLLLLSVTVILFPNTIPHSMQCINQLIGGLSSLSSRPKFYNGSWLLARSVKLERHSNTGCLSGCQFMSQEGVLGGQQVEQGTKGICIQTLMAHKKPYCAQYSTIMLRLSVV